MSTILKSVLFIVFLFLNCNSKNKVNHHATDAIVSSNKYEHLSDRPAVFAGSFYPGDAKSLSETLKTLFENAGDRQNKGEILALISPHAGYVYSGEVAASSYNQLDPEKKYENIFLIGSSHRVAFNGASVFNQGNYVTPLGSVDVNLELANKLIKSESFIVYEPSAHKNEHSLEVQLPFLQYHLKKSFKIVPVIIGAQYPDISQKLARALEPYFNNSNLFIISSDFSHYPSWEDAGKVDKETMESILSNSPETFLATIRKHEHEKINNLVTSACGWTSILTLLNITTELKDIHFQHIDYRNSGDTKYGDKTRVVGYQSIVAVKNNYEGSLKSSDRTNLNTMSSKNILNEEAPILSKVDKEKLLLIARETLVDYLTNRKIPEYHENEIPAELKEHMGAFVTLHKQGDLRGCIGRFVTDEPLYKTVQKMCISAAVEDHRFNPVVPDELKLIDMEISVLTPLRKIEDIDELELGKHGIYIIRGYNKGTFLPQVATETGWNKEQFLGHCARDKAGIGWDGWKTAELYIYEAEVFGEHDFDLPKE